MKNRSNVVIAAEGCPACGSTTIQPGQRANGFDIVRCRACGLGFVPAAQVAAVNYDELYKADGDYSDHVQEAAGLKAGHKFVFPRSRRVALEEIRQLQPATLLEVGCGVGNFLAWIESMGIRGYGVDVSSNAIDLASQYLSSMLHCGMLDDSTFDGMKFDMICTWEVLEHVHDVTAFMNNIYKRLKPGGRVYLSTPNYGSHWLWRDISADPRSRPPVHLTFWNTRSLEGHLNRAGFDEVRVRPFSFPLNAALRSAGRWPSRFMYLDCLARRSQRQTLLGRARKPATGSQS